MIRRHTPFFGWYIVGLMAVSMMLVYGIRNSFSVFFVPILDEFGWYRGSTAIMLSLNILVYGFTALVAGSLVDRWKPRRVAAIGIIVLTLATASCSFARELWHFYLLFGVVAPIGSAFCGAPVLIPSLINWFGKRRGLAMGLGQLGGGLSFSYGMLVELVISHLGWRPSFVVMAGLLIIVLLPLSALFFYHRPEDRGLTAYGTGDLSASEGVKDVENLGVRDWTRGTAIRTYHLWLLVLCQFCFWGTGNYLVLAHQIRFAVDAGYSSVMATSVFALYGIVSIAGHIAASISDSIGRERTVTLAAILAIGGMLALMSVRDTSQPWLLYVFSACFGLATGLFSPNVFVGLADIFHGRNIGAISSMLLLGAGTGGAVGPWLGGYIYDISGSYHVAFIISTASFGVACISFWIAAPRHADRLRAKI